MRTVGAAFLETLYFLDFRWHFDLVLTVKSRSTVFIAGTYAACAPRLRSFSRLVKALCACLALSLQFFFHTDKVFLCFAMFVCKTSEVFSTSPRSSTHAHDSSCGTREMTRHEKRASIDS